MARWSDIVQFQGELQAMQEDMFRFHLGISPKSGEGGRHLAARSISQLADAIAICVSSAGVITHILKGKEKVSGQDFLDCIF